MNEAELIERMARAADPYAFFEKSPLEDRDFAIGAQRRALAALCKEIELHHIIRKMETFAAIYTGDKEVREMIERLRAMLSASPLKGDA